MFNCDEDSITYEDLTETPRAGGLPIPRPCVGIEDRKCVSCETVRDTIKANPGNFFKDKKSAVESLFGPADAEAIKKENLEKLATRIPSLIWQKKFNVFKFFLTAVSSTCQKSFNIFENIFEHYQPIGSKTKLTKEQNWPYKLTGTSWPIKA